MVDDALIFRSKIRCMENRLLDILPRIFGRPGIYRGWWVGGGLRLSVMGTSSMPGAQGKEVEGHPTITPNASIDGSVELHVIRSTGRVWLKSQCFQACQPTHRITISLPPAIC